LSTKRKGTIKRFQIDLFDRTTSAVTTNFEKKRSILFVFEDTLRAKHFEQSKSWWGITAVVNCKIQSDFEVNNFEVNNFFENYRGVRLTVNHKEKHY
jgi:hypothetical protein